MSLYVARFPNGAIKIGQSADVPYRLAQLRTYYGVPLELLHTEPGGKPEESAWHRRFAHARLGRSEQFRPVAELMAAIGRPMLDGIDPEAVEFVEPANGRRMGLKLRPSLNRKLSALAMLDGRTTSDLLNEAIAEFLDLHRQSQQRRILADDESIVG